MSEARCPQQSGSFLPLSLSLSLLRLVRSLAPSGLVAEQCVRTKKPVWLLGNTAEPNSVLKLREESKEKGGKEEGREEKRRVGNAADGHTSVNRNDVTEEGKERKRERERGKEKEQEDGKKRKGR